MFNLSKVQGKLFCIIQNVKRVHELRVSDENFAVSVFSCLKVNIIIRNNIYGHPVL